MVCDITTGLQAYFAMTGNANDSTGNGNNGTPTAGAVLTTDKNSVANQAYDFNGTSGDIAVTNVTLPSGNSNFTISAWINLNTLSGGNDMIFQWGNAGAKTTMSLFKESGADKLTLVDDLTLWKSTTSLTTGWTYVVGTYDGTNMRLYIDGVLDNTILTGYTLNLGGGNGHIGSQLGTINWFPGKIDEVRIYNVALNQESITVLFNGYDNPSCIIPSKAIFFSQDL